MKTQKKIKLTSIMDVKEFVTVAGDCDFDINIFYNRMVIDAKSILGVLSLDLSNALTVEYEGYDRALEEILDAKDAAKITAVA
ncbi:MAG: HPr family phosphocarrier protein [Lachnospiraceae bacterium]|nr:HPr family phosphocarrier protein [Lachnospiraceae bacterium]